MNTTWTCYWLFYIRDGAWYSLNITHLHGLCWSWWPAELTSIIIQICFGNCSDPFWNLFENHLNSMGLHGLPVNSNWGLWAKVHTLPRFNFHQGFWTYDRQFWSAHLDATYENSSQNLNTMIWLQLGTKDYSKVQRNSPEFMLWVLSPPPLFYLGVILG